MSRSTPRHTAARRPRWRRAQRPPAGSPRSRPGSVAMRLAMVQEAGAQPDQLTMDRHVGVGRRRARRAHRDGGVTAPSSGVGSRPLRHPRSAHACQSGRRRTAGRPGAHGIQPDRRHRRSRDVVHHQRVPQVARGSGRADTRVGRERPSASAISVLDVLVVDAPRAAARRGTPCRLRYGPRAERAGARLDAVVKRQVLERVQRVVVDEDADRPLVRQNSAGARERRVNRVARRQLAARGCSLSVAPAGLAWLRSMPTSVTLTSRCSRILDEPGEHFLHVVVDVLAGAVDHHRLAVVHVVEHRRRCPASRRSAVAPEAQAQHAVAVALGDDRAAGVLVEHEARRRR